jgi:hypothetical protein
LREWSSTSKKGYSNDGLTDNEKFDEFLGGVPGDGYYGHPNLDIKNPFAKTQKKEKVLPKAPPAGAPGSGGLLNRTAAQMGDRNTELETIPIQR